MKFSVVWVIFGLCGTLVYGEGPSTLALQANSKALSSGDAKQLLKEFRKSEGLQIRAMEHRHNLELKELKAAHAARQKEWYQREKDVRHKFFAEHTNGPDRRAFIKDFLERRKAFLKMISDEWSQRIRDQEVRFTSVKGDQAARLKEFQETLQRGEKPAARLWSSGQ